MFSQMRSMFGSSGGGGQTQTFTFGGDSSGFPSFGMGSGGLRIGGMDIPIWMSDGGDDDGPPPPPEGQGVGGFSGFRIPYGRSSAVIGRPSRSSRENPFAGIKEQNYEAIKKKCLEEGILFEDPEFPADDSSLFFSQQPPRSVEWMRPKELCDNPKFFVGGASRFDIKQGELGDCWLLAAVASLTIDQKLLLRVVPASQSFDDDYIGAFLFKFWHQGDWIDVVVDDRLPVKYDRLLYMHSAEMNEFWSALLEKAYAKLNGSYESLKGGSSSEAMEDFTGGVTEMFDLTQPDDNLFKIMLKAFERSSLLGCSIDADPNELEAKLDNGLIMGHAYSITCVKMVDITTPRLRGQIPMVRIRNPWGQSEWNGPWSDQSQEWCFIPDDEKAEIGLINEDDGEFWMAYKDFIANFKKLEICNLGPDSLSEEELTSRSKKKWESTTDKGAWIPGVSAGGCRNYLETFPSNPQFQVTLTDPDDDDDDNKCTAIIAVLQKDRRKKRKEGLDMLTIGYMIYKLSGEHCGTLDASFFKYNASAGKSPSFINLREMCGRHKLDPGTYVIVPSTFEPDQKGEFILRVFTEKSNETHQMDEKTAIDDSQDIPPPSEREQEQGELVRSKFQETAGDDMEIDAFELKDILNEVYYQEFEFEGFGIDTCRSMVAMHDGDMSGKLGFVEFQKLWTDLRVWKGIFKEFDQDKSGYLNSYELRSALRKTGFHLSNNTLVALVMRYNNKEGHIEFGDFIMCAIRLKTMLASFRNYDSQKTGVALFPMENFIQMTMYS